MGQEQSHIPPTQGLDPGIYRIVSATAGTAISISSYGYDRVEAWARSEDDGQKWLIQRAGDGYTFNNRKHNTSYVAVGSTDIQSRIYASTFPTTWELLEQGDYYFINKPGQDRVLDLHWGEATNGNKVSQVVTWSVLHRPAEHTVLVQIHIRPRDSHPCKHWKFEYLEIDTKRFIHEHFGPNSKEGKYLQTIATLRKDVKEAHTDISKKNAQLSDCKDDLRRLQESLNEEECCSGTCPKMNSQTDQSAFHITNIFN
ncbi:hypothetical protein B0J17DRAFT_643227 [Rhizoctonia solani]|nr:hypothetical protein B0J17DRAFT_643227 [Rhizoctonia solani]